MSSIEKIAATIFEQIRRIDALGAEYWNSRELSRVLEYTDYRNFRTAIVRAKEACNNSGYKVSDHFVEINEMVSIGSGALRELDAVKLSRYACYLIVQNADPGKAVVAASRTIKYSQNRK